MRQGLAAWSAGMPEREKADEVTTRRERLERKVERRGTWSESARKKSAASYQRARGAVDGIPFGQPVLVGHHSERKHRRAIEKSDNAMRSSVEAEKLAEHHDSKARNLKIMLEMAIYDDDPDALEKLEAKAKACTENAEQCGAMNKAWKKGGEAELSAQFGPEIARAAAKIMGTGSRWPKTPFNATRDRAEARRCKARIEVLQAMRGRTERAKQAPGGVIITGGEHVSVTFAEKPDYAVIRALKSPQAGFRWGVGSWHGRREKLPEVVLQLAGVAKSVEGAPEAIEAAPEAAAEAPEEVDPEELLRLARVRHGLFRTEAVGVTLAHLDQARKWAEEHGAAQNSALVRGYLTDLVSGKEPMPGAKPLTYAENYVEKYGEPYPAHLPGVADPDEEFSPQRDCDAGRCACGSCDPCHD